MFLTAGALVMALVLMLKADALCAQCREILSFVIDSFMKEERSDSHEQSEN